MVIKHPPFRKYQGKWAFFFTHSPRSLFGCTGLMVFHWNIMPYDVCKIEVYSTDCNVEWSGLDSFDSWTWTSTAEIRIRFFIHYFFGLFIWLHSNQSDFWCVFVIFSNILNIRMKWKEEKVDATDLKSDGGVVQHQLPPNVTTINV